LQNEGRRKLQPWRKKKITGVTNNRLWRWRKKKLGGKGENQIWGWRNHKLLSTSLITFHSALSLSLLASLTYVTPTTSISLSHSSIQCENVKKKVSKIKNHCHVR